ncbi:MAG: hypothetical protein ACLFV6_13155 [Spirulinaceae cyanobacterium]
MDVQDIGAVAAQLLQDFPAENTKLDLTGPESLDFSEIAAIFTQVLGKQINYVSPNWFSFFRYRQQLGDAAAQILVMIMLYTITRFGNADRVTFEVEKIGDRAPTNFRDCVRENQRLWL